MAETLLCFAVRKLGDIAFTNAVEEVQLQLGTEDNIRFIKNELSSIKAFLRDAEKRSLRGDGAASNEWVSQVKDEAYKVEDVVEEFLVKMEILNSKTSYISYITSWSKQRVLSRRFHTKIQKIKKDVEEISDRRSRYNLQEGTTSISHIEDSSSDHIGMSFPFYEEAEIVGIDKDVRKLQDLLLKEEEVDHQKRSVVSLVGIAGSGKSTIAKKVFNSIKGKFDCSAWVPVSQTFELRRILKHLLEELCKSRKEAPPSGMEPWSIFYPEAEMIFNYLQGKRYILVLDDIWDVNAWEEIKKSLPPCGVGTVVITARMMDVASPVGENSYVHYVERLNSEFAWDLFCRKAFINTNPPGVCPQFLKTIGQRLVRKCDGLPLAIVAIGGLMSRKETNPKVWDEVLKNLDWELSFHQDLKRLNRVLLTSYNYLPSSLKYCFLYCGLFPEDSIIKRSRLIRLWVAEGFIEDHHEKSIEEVASDYFVQLMNRNMLQSSIYNDWQMRWTACSVHDLLRDMALQLSKEEEFGAVFKIQDNIYNSSSRSRGYRRLCVHHSEAKFSMGMVYHHGGNYLRSFLMFSQEKFKSSTLRKFLFKMKSLRVLDLSGAKIEYLPDEVGDLIYLRYLRLRFTMVCELPLSVAKLYNLQTLDVRNTNVESFPPGMFIATFKQLRHLLMYTASTNITRLEETREMVVDIMEAAGSSTTTTTTTTSTTRMAKQNRSIWI